MLHDAILNDSLDQVKEAVILGANINQPKEQKLPLLWAVLLRKTDAVEALLDLGAKPDKALVQYAISLHASKIACLLVIKGNIDLNTLYYEDDQNNQSTLMRILLRRGDFDTATFLACRNLELKNDDAVTADDSLVSAIVKNYSKNPLAARTFIQAIINHGWNVNNIWQMTKRCEPSLLNAFYNGEVLRIFTERGANPNTIIDMNHPSRVSGGNFTWTPLFRAIEIGNVSAVRVLLNAKADVNLKANPISSLGLFTPLSWAIHKGMGDIVAIVIKRCKFIIFIFI